MRDDENEVLENDHVLQNVQEDRIPPPMEPEPIVPRAAARANRRIRRQRENEEAAAAAAAAQEQGGAGDQEDNWREWDRFGDELTWQRLLGLDGSLIFLEHVFWVISLNTLFTATFGKF